MRWFLALWPLTLAVSFVYGQQHIAPTDALTPEEERKSFKVPDGFEVQLVASEAQIQKPMQIAFDAKGRLWVTTSRHYPFAAEKGKSTDKIFVLSDFGNDGHAKTVSTFDDKLNIPIGILPLPDGKSCIVSSVGEILKLTDTDGDGKADLREVLFTGFGMRDTHGMTNSFTLMPDGWVYACHGFSNESLVRGKDGHEVKMQSGNTFRFRTDGSRIEVFTRGQVNPFGMTADPWFNLYTADCHSKPITQLIKGAYYDSFGKPHDGLGYAPHVTRHDHGSTGLCGLAWYDADHFPKEWNGCMFLGNVVTNRINIDRIEWKGSTPVAKELPDFLVSSDPWFRPTDIKLGPDGALYVSDFYNKIIGHYEVDLKHPQRDKDKARIWRIVYKTKPFRNDAKPLAKPNRIANRPMAIQLLNDPSPHIARESIAFLADEPHPDNIAPLLALIPTIPAEDVSLKHAARIALRNALAAVPSEADFQKRLEKHVAEKSHLTTTLDDVTLGLPSSHAGWWLSERLKAGTVASPYTERAYQHVGRYGVDAHRQAAWLAAARLTETRVIVAMFQSMLRGVQEAGVKFQPAESPSLVRRVKDDLLSDGDALTVQTLRLAALIRYDTTTASLALLKNGKRSDAVRLAAFDAVEKLPDEIRLPVCIELVKDMNTPFAVKEKAISILATSDKLLDQVTLKDQLKSAPYRQCVTIANGLAGNESGADLLFATIRTGNASARLLQEKAVLERLKVTNPTNWEATVKELTAGIPSADARLAGIIRERGTGYKTAKTDMAAGKTMFTTNCANCHQLGGQGAKVGPQLDGIGNRGIERLLEDVLDPNRNVDHAFHTTILDMKDGRTLSGLLRVEGKVFIIIDSLAKEVRVSIDDVEKKRTSPQSPMPADVSEKLKPQEFYHLMAYLLDQRPK